MCIFYARQYSEIEFKQINWFYSRKLIIVVLNRVFKKIDVKTQLQMYSFIEWLLINVNLSLTFIDLYSILMKIISKRTE